MRSTSLLHVRTAGAALLGTALITAGALLAPVPAQATAASGMGIRAVGGDHQLTAAWTAITNATGYTVHWGSGTSTAHVLHTTGTTVRISGVANDAAYSVRVTADGVTAASARVTATPSSSAPAPVRDVKAVPAGPDRIRVSWTGGGPARSIAVSLGADAATKTHHSATGWYPAALSSIVVHLPASSRGVLGAGSGNPVFVRVLQTNSTARTPGTEWRSDSANRFRISDQGPWSVAGAVSPTGDVSPVTVASWNTQSVSATRTLPTDLQWAARLPKVVANVENLHPDVIGFQELGTTRVVSGCLNPRAAQGIYDCQEQYQTLQDRLGTAGPSVPTVYRTVRADANAYVYRQWAAGNSNNYVDSSIFYNPARVTVVSSGFISPRAIMGPAWPATYTDEAGVWAEFRTTDAAGRRFLMASIHLPSGGVDVSTVRRNEGAALGAWLDSTAAGMGGIPIVLAGDLNGNEATDPDSAGLQLLADGYTDAAATLDRTDIRWATDNLSNGPDAVVPGYPFTAVPHAHIGSRIDYLMLKGGIRATRYRNEIRYTTDSKGVRHFLAGYQASDHNMQLAWVGIPDPRQG